MSWTRSLAPDYWRQIIGTHWRQISSAWSLAPDDWRQINSFPWSPLAPDYWRMVPDHCHLAQLCQILGAWCHCANCVRLLALAQTRFLAPGAIVQIVPDYWHWHNVWSTQKLSTYI
jgi:hypothetical protein